MKVLLTGANGQLGWELQASRPEPVELLALDSQALDITDVESVNAIIATEKPDVIINAAAYTAVDKAEQERERAYAVNAMGAENLARASRQQGTRFIHVSTDFVFDGEQSHPYRPEDKPNPLGVYGASKLEGEQRVLAEHPEAVIFRTAWIYSAHGNNFVKTMLRLVTQKDRLGVVADQIGTPTWARTLAQTIWLAADKTDLSGIYHSTDAGAASWYDFAEAIQEEALARGLLEKTIPIRPIATADYPTPAKRPAYSVLDKRQTWHDLGQKPRHWRESLRMMLNGLKRIQEDNRY